MVADYGDDDEVMKVRRVERQHSHFVVDVRAASAVTLAAVCMRGGIIFVQFNLLGNWEVDSCDGHR